ncbi:hypothetical protein PUR49_08005 [Streptomyces sp. BE147]|uniref:hypothetical protein n=1 Tax=Streptomyces sp. BE147 TaxID=3002524 RepID=UPI002E78642E|nr:hypothetical protein [Streptomyces sp. BE147]MEE1736442.1 hypothetical protein [Streptomyces sp. BE147]
MPARTTSVRPLRIGTAAIGTGLFLTRGGCAARTAVKICTERDKGLGPHGGAKKFFPARASRTIYAVRTCNGVLALAPLAPITEVRVTRRSLRDDPSPFEVLYGVKTGPVVTDEFHRQAAACLPTQGGAQALGFAYAVTGAH